MSTSKVCNPVLETKTIKYSIQPGCRFLDAQYNPGTPHAHCGADINDVRGRDSDLGNRVRCVADGTVIEAGQEYKAWGGIVLIHHPELKVYTQYAHLNNIQVKPGQRVRMGDYLGQIGKGQGDRYWAHLHFEVRKSKMAADYWPGNHNPTRAKTVAFIRQHYLDPEAWLEQHSALRGYDEVMKLMTERDKPLEKCPDVPALPPQPAPGPVVTPVLGRDERRVLLDTGNGTYQDITGQRVEVSKTSGVVINAKGDTIWIRAQ